MKRPHIVFYTGAGMSAESGLPVFRGEGGLWESLDVEAVADRKAWYCGRCRDRDRIRQAVLDFINSIRRQVLEHAPSEGHREIAGLEDRFDVTVITQNGDDYHERAGSTDVIHLHGEALKNCSTVHPYEPIEIDPEHPDIHIGDKAPDGSQLRPFVIFFNEYIDRRLWKKAVEAVGHADALVVVGSSMLVYPAASLPGRLRRGCPVYVVDPGEVSLPEDFSGEYVHIRKGASEGLRILSGMLDDYFHDALRFSK